MLHHSNSLGEFLAAAAAQDHSILDSSSVQGACKHSQACVLKLRDLALDPKFSPSVPVAETERLGFAGKEAIRRATFLLALQVPVRARVCVCVPRAATHRVFVALALALCSRAR